MTGEGKNIKEDYMKTVSVGRTPVKSSAVAQGVMRMAEKSAAEAEKLPPQLLKQALPSSILQMCIQMVRARVSSGAALKSFER